MECCSADPGSTTEFRSPVVGFHIVFTLVGSRKDLSVSTSAISGLETTQGMMMQRKS
jgi:hypothetical protein